MKSIKAIIISFIITGQLLLPTLSNSTTPPSQANVLPDEKEKLSHFFSVAVAREPVHLILIEKNKQRLWFLEYKKDLKVLADYPIATGENQGNKKVSGDSRTPEGIYFITRIYKDKQVTVFGDRAFHLDYPNFFDRKEGRNGDGIFIHGTNRDLQPNSSNGCVILDKKNLDALEQFLQQDITPVIIVPEISTAIPDSDELIKDDYMLTKSLIFAKEIKPGNVEFNYLYLVHSGTQTVAMSDFTYHPFNRSAMQGTGKTYLEYLPAQGWSAGKRVWQTTPLQIYPETPGKIWLLPMSGKNIELPH